MEVCPEMLSAKPTLPTLTCLSDAPPRTLTRAERIEMFLREDAEAKSQIERLNHRRADLKALLKEMGEDAFERWYFQEHGEDMARIKQKEEKRHERRAALEERQRKVEERRANMTPARWESRIAGVKESTKEELKEEHKLSVVQRKEVMRSLRDRPGKASGSGS